VRIAVGCDHAGFSLKEILVDRLRAAGHAVTDFGTESEQPVDYPDFCAPAARAVAKGDADFGLVLGGSGQGEQIVANKVRGIRAALCYSLETARLARQHNDANVLAMGARLTDPALAAEILETFLTTGFENGRHTARVEKIARVESEG
jgi:ribose 5-phosphate isomerase B